MPDESSDRPDDPGRGGRPSARPPRGAPVVRDARGAHRRVRERRGGPASGRGEARAGAGSRPRVPRTGVTQRRAREDRGGSRLAPERTSTSRASHPRRGHRQGARPVVHHQLRTLSKENAEGVAQHLVMVAAQLEADDLDAALAHAETAVRRAGRVPAAREALGMVAYRRGDFARALTEFRTARRLSGSSHLLPLMVDCERGLGRHARALDLAASPEAAGAGRTGAGGARHRRLRGPP